MSDRHDAQEPHGDESFDALDGAADRLRGAARSTEVPTTVQLRSSHARRVRRRTVGGAAVAAVLLAVLGVSGALVLRDDDQSSELATEGPPSSVALGAPGSPTVDLGPPVECTDGSKIGFDLTPEQTAGSVRRSQEELMPTQMQVATYSQAQPEYVSGGFDNDASGSLVVAVFVDGSDLQQHLTELRSMVEFPDSVVVRTAPFTMAQMMAAQSTIQTDPSIPAGAVVSSGPHLDGLQVTLRADQFDLARRLAADYPGMMEFTIGAKRYVGAQDGALRRCERSDELERPALPTGVPTERTGPAEPGGVYAEDWEYPPSAPAGADIGVEYVLRSDRTMTWAPTGVGPIGGVVVRAGTDDVVGAAVPSLRRLALPGPVTVAPGEDLVIEVQASTASADDSDDPALPPGDYEIVASVVVDGTPYLLPRVAITLEPT